MPEYSPEYVEALIRAGDQLQSAMSRTADTADELAAGHYGDMGYEQRMALLEGRDAVAAWTAARRQHPR